MVAGRRFWGCNEERSAQHQAGRGGNLGIEAVVEDGLGAGEARRLAAGIEPGREVDEEDYGEAEQPEGEDDPAQSVAALVADHGERHGGGEHGYGDQEEGMGVTGALGRDGGGACRRQAGVTGLADLHRPVIGELGRDQTASGADDGHADRPLGGQHGAESGCRPPRPPAPAEQAPFQHREATKQEYTGRTQAAEQPLR